MPVPDDSPLEVRPKRHISVVLCGTFRQDPEGLARIYSQLRERFDIISPRSLEFVNLDVEFVRLADELVLSDLEVEEGHLAAITRADFVWLYAPGGYVGLSGAMELGHAAALGIPVFSLVAPREPVLAGFVHLVESPRQVSRQLLLEVGRPGKGLARLQRYYSDAAIRRGWDKETDVETLGLLKGEVDELGTAIEKSNQGVRPEDDRDAHIGDELADVQLYLVHLATIRQIELATAVDDKERSNEARFPTKRTG